MSTNKYMYQTSYPIRLICFIGILSTILFTSCGTRAPRYDYRELAQAAIRLDMDIAMEDNHRLYIESSQWIGVPYRAGGNTKRGVDCSGLTYNIYKKVYHKHLKRNSDEQRKTNCRKISKNKLQEGDLVFFHNGKNKRTATHVGIYLKMTASSMPVPVAASLSADWTNLITAEYGCKAEE